jgi:hypothetical protein
MSPGELWDTTPAEFTTIMQARIKDREQIMGFLDTLNGIQCSVLANVNRGADTDPFRPVDFMITRQENEPRTSAEEMDKKLMVWSAMGG